MISGGSAHGTDALPLMRESVPGAMALPPYRPLVTASSAHAYMSGAECHQSG